MSYLQYINRVCGTDLSEQLSQVELKYFKNIAELAMEQFYYKNTYTPDLTSQIIEQALFFRWNNCFYKLPTDEIVLCSYVPNSQFDRYFKPNKVDLLYFNGVQIARGIPYEDIIPIRDNNLDIPPYIIIMKYVKQLAVVDKSLDVNLINLRIPFVFYGDKKQQATLNKIYSEIDDFKPLLLLDKDLMSNIKMDSLTQANIKSPMEIYSLINEIKRNALETLGIYSVTGKKERLISVEAESQNDYADVIYQSRRRNRLTAIEAVQNKWGQRMNMYETYIDDKIQETYLRVEEEKKIEEVKENGKLLSNEL